MRKRQIFRSALCLLMAVVMTVTCISALSFTAAAESVPENLPEGQVEVARVGKLVLYASMETGEFSVYNTASGFLWKHGSDPELYDLSRVSNQWRNEMSCIISISHADMNSRDSVTKKAFAPGNSVKTTITKIKGGIRAAYELDVKINITVEITIDEQGLKVFIPGELIEENGDRGIVTIQVLSAFGASGDEVEGYIIYPDGSGGLTDFSSKFTRPKTVAESRWYIYGTDMLDIGNFVNSINTDVKTASLPVFGLKKYDQAYLATVEQGAAEAIVKFGPSGYPATIALNRGAFELTYRHIYEQRASNITVHGADRAERPVVSKVDIDMNRADRTICYLFLEGEEANYSGMANIYRNYLLAEGFITKRISEKDAIPLGLDLFVGIMEDMGIYKKQTVTTTFTQAQEILQALLDKDVSSIDVILKGWEKDGYNANPNITVNGRAGGMSDLKKLNEFTNENGLSLSLFTNFMFAYSDVGGFSRRNDIIYSGANIPITTSAKNVFVLSPTFISSQHEKLLRIIEDLDSLGIAYKNNTKFLYHDNKAGSKVTRDEAARMWRDLIGITASQGRTTAVDYGNLYSLKSADRVFNIPTQSSKNYNCDRDIPFVQMVLHGIIPYSTDPGNLSSDMVETKLRWIEYGCMPQYELTYASSVELKQTGYNRLFTSQYEMWLDRVVDIYKEFNDKLGKVWSKTVESHEQIAPGVVKLTYEGGTVIYINYNDTSYTVAGRIIPATDYIVV